jgi:hypothetical protein
MSKKTTITCLCNLEIENANEYEALTIADEMLKREYPLSEKVILIINETLNTTTDGCGVTYKEKNGNVRRDNSAEGVSSEPTEERRREAVG